MYQSYTMSRIHFVVREAAKTAYQDQARREGKSLGEWLREAAEEKLTVATTRKFTVEELREFAARCDALHPPDAREPDWPETKQMLVETRYPDYDMIVMSQRGFSRSRARSVLSIFTQE